jgi:alkylhydroperoxidase family enzyme
MTDARVPRLPVDEAKAAADEASVPNYMAELVIFQVLLNHPSLARAGNDLLATMLWRGSLGSPLRELVIMRTGWLTASDYEWTQHWHVAQGLGVSADDLLGERDWQTYDGFGPAERGGARGDRRRPTRRRGQRRRLGGLRTRIWRRFLMRARRSLSPSSNSRNAPTPARKRWTSSAPSNVKSSRGSQTRTVWASGISFWCHRVRLPSPHAASSDERPMSSSTGRISSPA